MKKASAFIAAIILLFAQGSLWAVWEGNAGVGREGNFPDSGMYVLSDMFPANTLVHIQNLETGLSARAVVAGKAGVPGIIASVSPEVAEMLNIKTGSVSRVRISIPAEIPETAVADFSNVLSDNVESEDPDLNPSAMIAMSSEIHAPIEIGEDVFVVEDIITEDIVPAGIAEAEENSPVLEVAAQEEPKPLAEVEDLPVSEVAVLDADERAPQAANGHSDDNKVEFVSAVAEEGQVEFPADAPVLEAAEVTLVPASMNPPPTPERKVSEIEPLASAAEEFSMPTEVSVAEVASISVSEEALPAAEEISVEEVARIDAVEAGSSIEEDSFVEEVAALYPIEAGDPVEEAAIAIVPPVPVPVEEEEALLAEEESETDAALEPVSTYITEYFYIPEEESSASPESEILYVESVLASESAPIEPGYYVQIASFSDSANIRRFVDSYSGKYPLAFVDIAPDISGGGKKVLVGSLAPDETGAVLEFFRNAGFKDAFVLAVN